MNGAKNQQEPKKEDYDALKLEINQIVRQVFDQNGRFYLFNGQVKLFCKMTEFFPTSLFAENDPFAMNHPFRIETEVLVDWERFGSLSEALQQFGMTNVAQFIMRSFWANNVVSDNEFVKGFYKATLFDYENPNFELNVRIQMTIEGPGKTATTLQGCIGFNDGSFIHSQPVEVNLDPFWHVPQMIPDQIRLAMLTSFAGLFTGFKWAQNLFQGIQQGIQGEKQNGQ